MFDRMKLLLLIFAAAFVAEVISDDFPPTGLVGVAGYHLIGDTGNAFWVAGADLKAKNEGPLTNAVGDVLKAGGHTVITVGDDITGGAVEDVVTVVGQTVENAGKELSNVPILGKILKALFTNGAVVVQKLGGESVIRTS